MNKGGHQGKSCLSIALNPKQNLYRPTWDCTLCNSESRNKLIRVIRSMSLKCPASHYVCIVCEKDFHQEDHKICKILYCNDSSNSNYFS